MQSPAVALALWKAPGKPSFTGGVGGFVWQSVQTCCGDLSGFSGLDAWWQTSHFPATRMWAEWENFTAGMLGPFKVMGLEGACWPHATPLATPNKASKNSTRRTLNRGIVPPWVARSQFLTAQSLFLGRLDCRAILAPVL
jgi:hypothetical protein